METGRRKSPSIPRFRRAKRRDVGAAPSSYPKPPRELAGKWVAWSHDRRIVYSADKLDEVMNYVERQGIRGVSYERLPSLERAHTT